MLRVEDVPPDEMPELIRVAMDLQDQDQDRTTRQRAAVDAAAEMDIPRAYLEQAAAELHARRVERIQTRRRRHAGLLGTLGAAAALGLVWHGIHPAAPAPRASQFLDTQWHESASPGSAASVTFGQDTAMVRVNQFGAGDSRYFVNLDTHEVPPTLAGYRHITFRARGQGLRHVRLYLENGDERWRSPALDLTADWRTFQLKPADFSYQVRDGGSWRRVRFQPPGRVEDLSFKFGAYVNDPSARGEADLTGLRFD